MKINQLYEAKALDEIPMCPQERLSHISKTTGLSFALKRIGPLAALLLLLFIYLHFIYLLSQILLKTCLLVFTVNPLIKTACQHLLLLVGFDTLIYRKYYDTPPILVGHQLSLRA